MKKLFVFLLLLVSISIIYPLINYQSLTRDKIVSVKTNQDKKTILPSPPPHKVLKNDYHIFQTFNNCGPAALSMALSYYGIEKTQEELGRDLRPYQNPEGNNDDKSVTLSELSEKSKEFGLIPFHRPNGDIKKIKLFIANDIPVITRTWLRENDDIGHYRIVKGYDQENIIQDDSLQGKNLKYTYENFNDLWNKFNFEYLVLVPKEKEEIVKAILGEDTDPKIAWENALELSREELEQNPNNYNARFNLSIALTNLGRYKEAISEFEKVENSLNRRALWYQIEPVKAYYRIGNYEKVLSITEKILNDQNRAFSELYILRGKVFEKQGNNESANQEYEKALLYNKNLKLEQ